MYSCMCTVHVHGCTRVHMGHVNVHKHKTCVYMCMFTCMGRACTFIHALAMYVYMCRRNEYYMRAACMYVHAYIVHVHVYIHVRVQA